uniref:Uncharacterized protein n=1 Tax=Rhizophora mucronata TaxID=61149 RepID=A0A2P2MYU8_RHIMU
MLALMVKCVIREKGNDKSLPYSEGNFLQIFVDINIQSTTIVMKHIEIKITQAKKT